MFIKDFNTPEECRQAAVAIANAKGLAISYEFYADNILELKLDAKEKLADGTLVPIHCYDHLKFGLTPAEKKKLAGQSQWNNQLLFYAKHKGMSVLYKFKFTPKKEPIDSKIALLNSKSKLYGYLKQVIQNTDLGVVRASLVHKSEGPIIQYSNLSDIPDAVFQVRSTDKDRAVDKLELNFYMPFEETYLNLKLAHIKIAAQV